MCAWAPAPGPWNVSNLCFLSSICWPRSWFSTEYCAWGLWVPTPSIIYLIHKHMTVCIETMKDIKPCRRQTPLVNVDTKTDFRSRIEWQAIGIRPVRRPRFLKVGSPTEIITTTDNVDHDHRIYTTVDANADIVHTP